MGFPLGPFTCSWLALVFILLQARDVQAVVTGEACFTFGSAHFYGLGKPTPSRKDWWCSSDLQYGFMG